MSTPGICDGVPDVDDRFAALARQLGYRVADAGLDLLGIANRPLEIVVDPVALPTGPLADASAQSSRRRCSLLEIDGARR